MAKRVDVVVAPKENQGRPCERPVAWIIGSSIAGMAVGVGLYFWNGLKRDRASPYLKAKPREGGGFMGLLEAYKSECLMSKERMSSLVEDLVGRMGDGLSRDNQMLKMLPSFVETLPTGEESGEFIAIDLGGTNVRVVKVVLESRQVKEVVAHEDAIPKALMRGTTKELFDFIADHVKTFLAKNVPSASKSGASVPIGFTFSYPMKQTGIKNGELICWTKGFNIKDTLGKDLVGLLEASLKERKVNGSVFAILNDTVGTLAASRYIDRDTQLGVILGTGSNAAYIERNARIDKLKGRKTRCAIASSPPPSPSLSLTRSIADTDTSCTPLLPPSSSCSALLLRTHDCAQSAEKMIINIEWGNFKSKFMPYLDVDREIDEGTLNKGSQHFEKMISGMYLGEMVRLVCLRASRETNLFGGTQQEKLSHAWSFPTSLVSSIDGLGAENLGKVKALLAQNMGISKDAVSDSCALFVAELCKLIGDRSAALAAAGIVAIHKYLIDSAQVDPNQRFVAAVDGGLFEHYPKYPERMNETFARLLGKSHPIELVHSPDGSGIGCAVVAAATAAAAL